MQVQLLRMVREVALGVYYLHCFEPPVLHLDLKSANVLLDANRTCKVCDFGMSRVLGDATAVLADGMTTSRGSVGVRVARFEPTTLCSVPTEGMHLRGAITEGAPTSYDVRCLPRLPVPSVERSRALTRRDIR